MNDWEENIGDVELMLAKQLQEEIDRELIDELKAAHLSTRIAEIEKRLAILQDPDPDVLENWPALQEAYEQYRLTEKLVFGET